MARLEVSKAAACAALLVGASGCCTQDTYAAAERADGTYSVLTDCPGEITSGQLVVTTSAECPPTTAVSGTTSLGLPGEVRVVGNRAFELHGGGINCQYSRVAGQGVLVCAGSSTCVAVLSD